ANLNGKTCVTAGFAGGGGTLTCGAGCAFDTSGCWSTRFVDNADGTITDNATGLMWEKKTELDGGYNYANPHDADNVYRHHDQCSINFAVCQPTAAAVALCTAQSENGIADCRECTLGEGTCDAIGATTIWTFGADLNNTNFAGHADWRVPTRAELVSITDYTDTTAYPVVNVAFHGASCGAACTDFTNAACSCTRSGFYWSATNYAPD